MKCDKKKTFLSDFFHSDLIAMNVFLPQEQDSLNQQRRFFVQGEEEEYYKRLCQTEFPMQALQNISSTLEIRRKMRESFRPCTMDNIPVADRVTCKFFKDGRECFSLQLPMAIVEKCPCMQYDNDFDYYAVHQPEYGFQFELEEEIVKLLFLPIEILFFPATLPATFEHVRFFCKAWQQLDFLGRFTARDHETIASTFSDLLSSLANNHFQTFEHAFQETNRDQWTVFWSDILHNLANTGLLKYLLRSLTIAEIALMCPTVSDLNLLGCTAMHDSLFCTIQARAFTKPLIPWFVAQGMFGRDTRLESLNIHNCVMTSNISHISWNCISLFLLWAKRELLDSFALSANTDICKILVGYHLPAQQRFELCILSEEIRCCKRNNIFTNTDILLFLHQRWK